MGALLPPTFAFIDPYGFKVPAEILRELMQAGRVELFLNLMWRQLDMEMINARENSALAAVVDPIFDGPDWRSTVSADSSDGRAEQAVNLLASKVGGRWPTFIRMLGENRATRYILLHLTNHDEGRDLMKECMWKVCPEGGFFARKTDDPAQQVLITPEPNLHPLQSWVVDQLREAPMRWSEVLVRARPTLWRETHVNRVIRSLRERGEIVGSDYSGRFSGRADPLLSIPAADH